MRISWLPSLLLILVACDSDGVLQANAPEEGVQLTDPVGVLHTTDGDTLEVIRDHEEFEVRLKGIDTPELWPKDGDPPNWEPDPFAPEAWSYVASAVGARVGLEYDEDCQPPTVCRDTFNRVLAYVRLEDGRDLGLALLEAGLADVFIFEGEAFDRMAAYQEARDVAQAAGVGVWSLEAP